MDDFFHERGFQLVGVQEGRMEGNQCIDLPHYFAYTSSATADGQVGTQIWLHRSLQNLLSGIGCHPRSSRILRLESSRLGLTFSAVSAHAPTAVAPYEERKAFWAELESELGNVNHPSRLLVFIDANDDDGTKGCNANCSFSAELKEAFSLTDVAEWHDCAEPTWFGNSLFPKRSDHIWASDWWLRRSVAAGVEQDPMVFTTRDDHHMVWANISVDKQPPRGPPGRRLDAHKLRDPNRRDAFAADLRDAVPGLRVLLPEGPDAYHTELIKVVQGLQDEHFFSEATQVPLKP